MRVLALGASLRRQSLNQKLIVVAAEIAKSTGAEVDLAHLGQFPMPLYDADMDGMRGPPPGAESLRRRVDASQAILIASPEYNYSISGVLKNAIDWVSRARPMPWRGKSVYLLSASPSPMGGIRGLWQTRIPLEGCGALVFPDMFALSHAHAAFDDEGRLRDAVTTERLTRELTGFLRLAESVAPICAAGDPDARRQINAALESESALQPRPH